MLKRGIILVLILVVVINSNFVLAATEVSMQNIITDIEVTGNKVISDEEIMAQIDTKVGEEISNQKLKDDMQAIFDLGYFFDIRVNFKNYQDGVKLVFEVVENPQLVEIKIEGNENISNEKLKELLTVKTGQILNVNHLDESTKSINKYYQDKGYVLASVVDVTIKDKDKLVITVDEGRINKILIEGNSVTKDYVITRELSMESGQVFNINRMWDDLRGVYNLGYFKDIKPEFKPVKDNKQAVDLVIKVEEKKTRTFTMGGGYSSASGLTGLIDLSFDNLGGRGQKLSLNWEFGEKTNDYEIGFYEPWAFGTETSLNFNLYNKTEEEVDDVEYEEKGGDVTVGRPLTEDTNGYIKLDYNNTKADGEEEENTRSITLKTIRDTRDNILAPKEGSREEVSVEKAGFGGDTDFSKYKIDFRKYLPSGEDNSWACRLKLGTSSGELSGSERYYLTGMDKIRGYNDNYFDDENNPEENGFIGESVLVGNLEYRFKIVDKVTGIAFIDTGKTFENNDINLEDFHYSIGMGARFNTPIGQLGLDYGYAPSGELDEKTDFTIKIGNSF